MFEAIVEHLRATFPGLRISDIITYNVNWCNIQCVKVYWRGALQATVTLVDTELRLAILDLPGPASMGRRIIVNRFDRIDIADPQSIAILESTINEIVVSAASFAHYWSATS